MEYKNALNDLERKNRDEYNDYRDRQKQFLSRKEIIESKLNKLYKKQMPYPEFVTKLIDEINNKLNEKHDNLIVVRPVCEFVEINDEEYRNVIEGYLNTQKFDLIVEPKHFNEVVRIYEEFKNENSVYGIGIINVNKLKEKEELENSLYSKLNIKNEYAKLYMNNLLSRVVCVNNTEELKNYEISVTKSCMTYKNNVVRKINPKYYEESYIGVRAQEIQLKKLKENLLNVNNLLEEINEVINKKQIEKNKIDNSKINEIIDEHKKYKLYLSKQEELENNKNDLKEYERDDIFKDLINKQTEIELEIKEKNIIIENKRQEISNLESKKEVKEEKKKVLSKEVEERIKNELPIENGYEEKYLEIKNKDIEKIQGENLSKKIKIISDIENIEKSYNEKYSFDEIPNFTNVQRYLETLFNMRERELKKYQEDCSDLEKKCEISFKEDFVNKISGYIENACDNIKQLNRNLKKHQFGNEKYEFIYKPSIDYNFSKYYEIITSGKVYNSNTLFDEELSDKDREIMDELFRMITTNYTDESINKTLDRYTDYRKYMSYDIKVTNDQGDSYYFSKVSKEKSGGEIQTPCYVMIAASFDELRKNTIRDDSIGCIVLFDEAFNKMDDMRISTLMEFYNKLNIQLIISTPPDKFASISPYVDTNMIVLKNNNKSYIEVCTKEDINEL